MNIGKIDGGICLNKAIFLDRDGTLNYDYGYVHDMDHFQLLPGVLETLLQLEAAGYLLIIITNQSGIGRGYYSEEDYLRFEKQIEQFFDSYEIHITATYHCPHYQENCNCRKPKVGLFYRAANDYNIDFSQSYVVGDKLRDLEISRYEPIKGIYLGEIEDNTGFICVRTFAEILNYCL